MHAFDLPKPLQTLLEISKVNRLKINLSKQDNDFLPTTLSQMGGMGYLPIGETYPTKSDGTPLVLLAQLNFRQIGDMVDISQLAHPLPTQGILQIYIDGQDDDYLYGADFDKPLPSETYQVRFWQDDTVPMNIDELTDIAKRLKSLEMSSLPFDFDTQLAMTFTLSTQSCDLNCFEYAGFAKHIDDLKGGGHIYNFLNLLEEQGVENVDEYYERYQELANAGEHQLLGYPDFTQTDPREYEQSLQEYILLLQIETDDDNGIMWGDCGVANFFIHPNDLKNQDFSKLVYNWDCC